MEALPLSVNLGSFSSGIYRFPIDYATSLEQSHLRSEVITRTFAMFTPAGHESNGNSNSLKRLHNYKFHQILLMRFQCDVKYEE